MHTTEVYTHVGPRLAAICTAWRSKNSKKLWIK